MRKLILLVCSFLFLTHYLHAQDNALSFGTISDFVSLGNGFGQFGTTDFTIETWFKTGGSTYQPIIVKGPTGGACQHQNFWAISVLPNGKLRFEVDENNSGLNYGVLESPLTYNNNQWHHVACTRSGTSVKMYVNGNLVSSATTAGVTNLVPNGSAEIGRGYCGHFNGTIDEIRVWNYARTATQISEAFAVPTVYPQSGLVNYLDFNVGTAGGNNSGQIYLTDKISPYPSYTLFFFTLNGASSNWVTSTRTTISSVTSSLGSDFDATGKHLVIVGNNLTGATASGVKVGGVPVYEIISNTGTTLVVRSYTASSGKVTVSTPSGGIASSTTNFNYTYVAQQNALHFDGTNDFVNMTPYAGLFYTNDFTVEAWFNTTGTGTNMPIISKRPGCGASNFWNITITNGRVAWEQYQNISGLNSLSLLSPLTYNNGSWHHVAVTRSGTLVKMYIDGNFVISGNTAATTNINDSVTNVQIGRSPCGFYVGRIDEVRIWNVAKTAAEINSTYTSPVTLPQTNLRSYIGFNQGIPHGNNTSLTTITDINGLVYSLNNFALNGTISNYVFNNAVPIPFISAVDNTFLCAGIPLTIFGSNLSNIPAEQISIGGTAVSSGLYGSSSPWTVMPTPGSSGYVMVTTISGSAIAPQMVTINPTLNVTASASTNPICQGNSVTLVGGGATSYSWTGGITDNVAFTPPVSSETYTVTGTDANNCTATSSLILVVNPSPSPLSTITTSSNVLCVGESSILHVSNTCDTIFNFIASYAPGNWVSTSIPSNVGGYADTSNSPLSINLVSGNNYVQGSVFYDITIPASGVISFNWSYSTQDGAAYDYPRISLNGGSPAMLNGFTQTAGTATQSGTQSLAVNAGDVLHWIAYTTDGAGGPCTTTYSNFKFVPTCTNTILWNPGSLNGSTQIVQPMASTTYSVTVTNAYNCSATASQLITVHPAPGTISIQANPAMICAGESSVLSVNPPCTDTTWSNLTGPFDINQWTLTTVGLGGGSVDTSAAPNALTFYYPTFVADLTYDVTIPETGVISFNWSHFGGNFNTCTPGYQLNANQANVLYGFNQNNFGFQSGTQTINVTAGDVLHLIASNYGGGNMNNSVTTISNFQYTTNCTNSLSWNSNSINGYSPTVTPSATTTYTATLSNVDGCVSTATSTVIVNSLPEAMVSASLNSVCQGGTTNLTCIPSVTHSSPNSGSININDFAPANPYPSTVTITSLPVTGTVLAKVYINGLSHTFPDDIDMWLQSPSGQIVMLMSDVGGGTDIVNANLIFSDNANTSLPNLSMITPGTYKPTNFELNTSNEPINPSLLLSSFTGNLNGLWSLYIRDDANTDIGSVTSFQLEFTSTSNLVSCSWSSNPSIAQSGIANPQNFSTTAMVNQSTVYSANISDVNGCTNSATIMINANPLPIIDSINASAEAICMGGSSSLSLSPNCMPILNFTGLFDTNHWTTTQSSGSNGSVNTSNAPASIDIIYPDNTGFSATTSYSITIPSNGVVTFNWQHNTSAPYLMSLIYPNISLNNNPAAIFNGFNQYGNGNQTGTQSINVLAGDVLNLIMYNAYGLSSGGAITQISNLLFTPNCTNTNTISWNPGALSGPSPMVTPNATTTYTVTATDVNGCMSTASKTITVNPLPNVTASASVTSLCPAATNSLHFDGANDYISQPTTINGSNGTWEAWVKKENWADHHDDRLFGNGINFDNNNSFYISLHPAVGFHFRYGGTQEPNNIYTSSGNTFGFAPNSWHHLAATWEHLSGTTTIALYIDGVQVSSATTSLALSLSAPTFIGGDAYLPKFGPGNMEEVRLWNIAKTPTDIAAHKYDNTLYPQSGLYSLITFDASVAGGNNTGLNTLTDLATPSITSTLYNFALNGNTSNFVSDSKALLPNLTLTGIGAATYNWSNGVNNGELFLPTATQTYSVVGTDANGCTGTSEVLVSVCNVTVNLKAYIQGYYIGGGWMNSSLSNQGLSNPLTDADSVTIELHQADYPYAKEFSYKGALQTDGNIQCPFPAAAHGGSYYIVVKQRNAVETWSANPVNILSNTTYDFSISLSQAYGANQIEVEPNVFAFYSGDNNQDGVIDAFDYLDLDADITAGAFGYLSTDLTGDGAVDAFDYLIMDPNLTNGIGIITP